MNQRDLALAEDIGRTKTNLTIFSTEGNDAGIFDYDLQDGRMCCCVE